MKKIIQIAILLFFVLYSLLTLQISYFLLKQDKPISGEVVPKEVKDNRENKKLIISNRVFVGIGTKHIGTSYTAFDHGKYGLLFKFVPSVDNSQKLHLGYFFNLNLRSFLEANLKSLTSLKGAKVSNQCLSLPLLFFNLSDEDGLFITQLRSEPGAIDLETDVSMIGLSSDSLPGHNFERVKLIDVFLNLDRCF